jgi:formylglycine-generating enzyme required for sulfatase activity
MIQIYPNSTHALQAAKGVFIFLVGFVYVSNPLYSAESEAFANKVIEAHKLTKEQAKELKRLLTKSHGITRNIGTEDPNAYRGPNNSYHPVTRARCREKILDTHIITQSPQNEKLCQAPWMVPVPDADGNLKVCVDQFEFPDIPCEYPVVWVPSHTAHQICQAMGKRLCNAHEWEGACSGEMKSVDSYRFDIADLNRRRRVINQSREKEWAFNANPKYAQRSDTHIICGVYDPNDPDIIPDAKAHIKAGPIAGLSKGCNPSKSAYRTCGTNTWPAGYKYECRSRQGVYDMHGNVAEIVNLPFNRSEIARGTTTGHTERKGSFFVDRSTLRKRGGAARYPDDCHFRQPYEHTKLISRDRAHSFYQEGFRCCKDIP